MLWFAGSNGPEAVGYYTQSSRGTSPSIKILYCPKNVSSQKIFFHKYKILCWKSPTLGEFRDKIHILSTHNLLCCKFVAVCQKTATATHILNRRRRWLHIVSMMSGRFLKQLNWVYTLCLKKRHPFYFCDIFVKFHLILLIFGRNMPQEIWNKHMYMPNSYIVLYVRTVPCKN